MKIKLLLSVVLLASLLGCAANSHNRTFVTGGIIYGYIEHSDPKEKLNAVFIDKDVPGYLNDYGALQDGTFHILNRSPGTYSIDWFTFHPRKVRYEMKGKSAWKIKVDKPGFYYMGAVRVVETDSGGIFSKGTYRLQPLKSPTEREVLIKVRKRLGNTAWGRKVDERIRELSR